MTDYIWALGLTSLPFLLVGVLAGIGYLFGLLGLAIMAGALILCGIYLSALAAVRSGRRRHD
jgi:hypothetical protein